MAKNESRKNQKFRVEALDLLNHLGYSIAEAEAGVLQEVMVKLIQSYEAGYRQGHSEGHANGWEDHGREKGCNCS